MIRANPSTPALANANSNFYTPPVVGNSILYGSAAPNSALLMQITQHLPTQQTSDEPSSANPPRAAAAEQDSSDSENETNNSNSVFNRTPIQVVNSRGQVLNITPVEGILPGAAVAIQPLTTKSKKFPTITIEDFKFLSPAEHYDKFITADQFGLTANCILRELISNEVVPAECGKTLGKTKKEKKEQRTFFEKIAADKLADFHQVINSQMSKLAKKIKEANEPPPEKPDDAPVDLSDSLTVRMVHMVLEEKSRAILDLIYGTVDKNLRRAELDDKTLRTIEHWRQLAADYFNNPLWRPDNIVNDHRCVNLHPMFAPLEPLLGEQLRTMFNDVRTKYSRMYGGWKQSGLIEQGADNGEGDDDFFINFCGRDPVYLYIHIVYGRTPPSYCMRSLEDMQQCEEGIAPQDGTREAADTAARNEIEFSLGNKPTWSIVTTFRFRKHKNRIRPCRSPFTAAYGESWLHNYTKKAEKD